MHTKDARAIGETEQRIYALPAWRDTPYVTQRERAALTYKAVTAKQRDALDAQVNTICQGVAVIAPKLPPVKKAAAVNVYKTAVAGLQKAGWLSATQAANLTTLAGSP